MYIIDMDANLINIIPPIIAALFAYLIARKRSIIADKHAKAKLDADIQTQALNIVSGVMSEMKQEFRREIESLRTENNQLKLKIEEAESRIDTLRSQLDASDKLISALRSEINTLQSTINFYEKELDRLKK